jgi:hypothetical protein
MCSRRYWTGEGRPERQPGRDEEIGAVGEGSANLLKRLEPSRHVTTSGCPCPMAPSHPEINGQQSAPTVCAADISYGGPDAYADNLGSVPRPRRGDHFYRGVQSFRASFRGAITK